jgi:hypothetical protein
MFTWPCIDTRYLAMVSLLEAVFGHETIQMGGEEGRDK